MDDLKLYADSEVNLGKLLQTVEDISSAISMKINQKKCAVAHYVPGLEPKSKAIKGRSAKEEVYLNFEGSLHYKYLGMKQEFTLKDSFTWDRVKERCIGKFKKIWASNLTFRQKVNTHNSAIIPALTYVSANIIKGCGNYDEIRAKGKDLYIEFRACLVKAKGAIKQLLKHDSMCQ